MRTHEEVIVDNLTKTQILLRELRDEVDRHTPGGNAGNIKGDSMAINEKELLRENRRLKAELEDFTEGYQRASEAAGRSSGELSAIRMHLKHVAGVPQQEGTLQQVQTVVARLRMLEAKAELAAALEQLQAVVGDASEDAGGETISSGMNKVQILNDGKKKAHSWEALLEFRVVTGAYLHVIGYGRDQIEAVEELKKQVDVLGHILTRIDYADVEVT